MYKYGTEVAASSSVAISGRAVMLGSTTADTLVVNAMSTQGVGITGSDRAVRMVQDAASGIDSVDIVHVGDSNIGSSAAGVWGYSNGWCRGFIRYGAAAYACHLASCATGSATTVGSTEFNQPLSISIYNGRVAGQPSGTAGLLLGSAQTSYVNSLWNNGGNTLLLGSTSNGGYGCNWAFVPGTTTDLQASWFINVTDPAIIKGALTFRVGVAKSLTGSPSFNLNINNNTTTALATQEFFPVGSEEIATYELSIAANNRRSGTVNFYKYGWPTSPAGDGVTGPFGFVYESFYRPGVKGFASNALQYYSGATTSIAAGGVLASGETITTYLRELRERQIAAGGSGRVMIWLNSGINGGPAPASNWTDGATVLHGKMSASWDALGYPPEDLAFLMSVTHQRAAVDDLAATRAAAKTWCDQNYNATFVDLSEVTPYGDLLARSYFRDAGNIHLTNDGYDYVAEKVIGSLIGVSRQTIRLSPGQVTPVSLSGVTTGTQPVVVLS